MCQPLPSTPTVPGVGPKSRRHPLLRLALFGGLVAGGLLVARLVVGSGAPGRVYSLAAVRTLLEGAPARWLGQGFL